jgi:hypothetical protein
MIKTNIKKINLKKNKKISKHFKKKKKTGL